MSTWSPSSTFEAQERLYEFPYHHIPQWGGGHFQHYRALLPAFEYATYLQYLIRRAQEIPFRTVLDFGCGDGRFCAELRAAFPDACITGVDVSARAIAFARAFVPECEFVCADLSCSDAAPGPFDVVFMVEVLEHLPPAEIPRYFSAIAHRLSSGGRLLLTVPSSNVRVPLKHYQHFDAPRLCECLEEFFSVDDLVPLNRKSYLDGVLYRLMGNRFFLLSHQGLLDLLFKTYRRRFLRATFDRCRRLFAMCTVRVKPVVKRPLREILAVPRDLVPPPRGVTSKVSPTP